MLNLDTLYWDAWDGNITRLGAAMGLLEGKLLSIGGAEAKDKFKDVHQFNMGGYMMTFDGVDDEIMIPHLPTILPTQYTIEAWVRPSKVRMTNLPASLDGGEFSLPSHPIPSHPIPSHPLPSLPS
jgi:hypothetical protein